MSVRIFLSLTHLPVNLITADYDNWERRKEGWLVHAYTKSPSNAVWHAPRWNSRGKQKRGRLLKLGNCPFSCRACAYFLSLAHLPVNLITADYDNWERRKGDWLVHAYTKSPSNAVWHAPRWNSRGKQKRGRPHNAWRQFSRAERQQLGLSVGRLEMLPHDRWDGTTLLTTYVPKGLTGFKAKPWQMWKHNHHNKLFSHDMYLECITSTCD